jgi:hypothetical protein
MGEVFYCRPLTEKDGVLMALKARANTYPLPLQKALIASLWEAGFSLENCHKPAARGDVTHVTGFLYRAASVMIQALFGLNKRYCINEKGAIKLIDTFPLHPVDFSLRVSSVLGKIGTTPEELHTSVGQCEKLLREVQALCEQAASG